jgi:hypothetical protein
MATERIWRHLPALKTNRRDEPLKKGEARFQGASPFLTILNQAKISSVA